MEYMTNNTYISGVHLKFAHVHLLLLTAPFCLVWTMAPLSAVRRLFAFIRALFDTHY